MLKTIAALLATSLLVTVPAVAAEPTYDWTGAYLGLSVGGAVLGGTATTDLPEVPPVETPLDATLAPELGLSAGYNWMLNDLFLFGIEGDTSVTLPPAN